MKKIFSILLIIFLAYSCAYLFVGKAKNYKYIPKSSDLNIKDAFEDFGNFLKNLGKTKVSHQDSIDAMNFFKDGIDFYNKNNLDQAKWSFYDATKKNPYFEDAIYWSGKTDFFLNDYYSSEDEFNKLIALNENYDSAYYFLVKINYLNQQYTATIDYAIKFLLKQQESKEIIDLISWSYFYANDTLNAILNAQNYIKIAPEDSTARFNLAYFYIQKADNAKTAGEQKSYYIKSINQNRYCIKLAPNYKEAIYNTQYAYQKLNRLDSALYFAKMALKIDPNYDLAYGGLAKLYFDNKDYKTAINYATKAIAINDSSEYYYYYRAYSYYYENKFLQAAEDLEQCYKYTTKNSYLLEIADAYKEADSTKKAIFYYSKYIEDPYISESEKDSVLKLIENIDALYKLKYTTN